jgi:hypothetical protein
MSRRPVALLAAAAIIATGRRVCYLAGNRNESTGGMSS